MCIKQKSKGDQDWSVEVIAFGNFFFFFNLFFLIEVEKKKSELSRAAQLVFGSMVYCSQAGAL